MAVYVEIQTDPFKANLNHESLVKSRSTDRGVRRPFRGIEIKEDTYAVMKVIRADGSEIPLTDSGGELSARSGGDTQAGTGVPSLTSQPRRATNNYSNFIIQSVDENREEKAQIMETFGEAFVFFFGEKPRSLQVQGVLLNTLDFNWRTEFWYNYEKTLRGTKLVEQNARLYLYWDDLVVEGYMMDARARDVAENPYHIAFAFTLFVTNHTYLSQIGVDDYPIRNAINLQPLLQSEDVEGTQRELKSQLGEAAKYVSNVDKVRRANIAAVKRERAGQWLNNPKAMLTETIQRGISDAGLGFINNVVNFFFGRNMVWPRGIAGSESYAGLPQYANRAYPYPFKPQRVIPLRSKIRDNVDEYTSAPQGGVAYDLDYLYKVQQQEMNRNCYDMELKAVKTLADMGLNVIQKPYGMAGPLSCAITNALDVLTEDVASELPDLFSTFDSGVPQP